MGNYLGALFLAIAASYPAQLGFTAIDTKTYTSSWSSGSKATRVTHTYSGMRAIQIGIGWLALAAILGIASLCTVYGGIEDWNHWKATATWVSSGLIALAAVCLFPPWAITKERRSMGFYGALGIESLCIFIAFRIANDKLREQFIKGAVFILIAGLLCLGALDLTDLAISSILATVTVIAAMGHAMILTPKWRAAYLEFAARQKRRGGP